MTTKRRFKLDRGGKNGKKEETKPDALDALEGVLSKTPEGLGESWDMLRLIGVVVGQVTLLDIATGTANATDRVAASRALVALKEEPVNIAERLRSSQFSKLNTSELHQMIEDVKGGKNPKLALDEAVERSKNA